mgnify:CR=1 FL=1|tara:strand:+ start:1627 stop:2721 length:1095 start_codon:yes stop_codon:yes gene_type:complete
MQLLDTTNTMIADNRLPDSSGVTTYTMIADAKLDLTQIEIAPQTHGAVAAYAGVMHHLQADIPVWVRLTASAGRQTIEVKALYLDHLTPADLPANPSESAEVVVDDDVATVAGRCVTHSYCEQLTLTMRRTTLDVEPGDWTFALSGDGANVCYTTVVDKLDLQLSTMAAMRDLAIAISANNTLSATRLTDTLAEMRDELVKSHERGVYGAMVRGKAIGAIMDLAQAEISIKMAEAGQSMSEIVTRSGVTPREQAALAGQIVDCASPQMPFSGKELYRHLTGRDTFYVAEKRLQKKIDAAGLRLHDVRNTGCLLGDRMTERLEQLCIEMAHSDAIYEDHQRDIYDEAEADHHDNVKAEAEAEMAA